MHNITVKNVPSQLYTKIKHRAQENRRSINNEIIYCLENSLASTKIDAEHLLSKISHFYEHVEMPRLTDKIIKMAKEEGRE